MDHFMAGLPVLDSDGDAEEEEYDEADARSSTDQGAPRHPRAAAVAGDGGDIVFRGFRDGG
jgi:hypothetical protein